MTLDLGLRLDWDWCRKLSVTIVIMLTTQLRAAFWRVVKNQKEKKFSITLLLSFRERNYDQINMYMKLKLKESNILKSLTCRKPGNALNTLMEGQESMSHAKDWELI